jgi:hypothetical protein
MKYLDPDLAVHPLRNVLTQDDWTRIQEVIEGKHDDATLEEIEAAQDVYYDAVVAKLQTHDGVTTVQ